MLFLRVKHILTVSLMKMIAGFMPGSQHRAFLGTGSSAQLCRHIIRTGVKKVMVVQIL